MAQKCFCIIKHAVTAKERKAVKRALDNARQTGDSLGIIVTMAALTGKCPAVARVCK